MLPPAEHARFVCSLYKRALKLASDWKRNPETRRRFELAVREQFDRHRTDPPEEAIRFVRSVEYLLHRFSHPEPYIYPADPNGVAWRREVKYSEEFLKNGDGRGKLETLC